MPSEFTASQNYGRKPCEGTGKNLVEKIRCGRTYSNEWNPNSRNRRGRMDS